MIEIGQRRFGTFIAIACGLAVFLAVGAGVVLEFPLSSWLENASPESIKRVVISWGKWGVIASILLMVLHSFVPFPAEFVAIANGMCYGPVWGTVITWIGAMLGALLAFALSRRFGRPFVQRMIKRRDWRQADDWLGRHGGKAVFLCRFIPVIAFNLINYAAGLTKVSYWTFIWATGLGILPMTILMVVIGAELHRLPLYAWVLTSLAALALWFVAARLLSRRVTSNRTAG